MSRFTYRLPHAITRDKWTENINADEDITGIPPSLSWDAIAGHGCRICRTHDFMNYLHYVEHSSENFKFYLWYQDYCKRFNRLPQRQKDLSPPFIEAKPMIKARSPPSDSPIPPAQFSQPTPDDAITPSKPRRTDSVAETLTEHEMSSITLGNSVEGRDLFKLQQSQPFRAELTRITSLFLTPNTDSPLELNLDDRDRLLCLCALSHTTHPSALKPALRAVEIYLRLQSHPTYCRRKIQNSRRERGWFMAIVGVGLVVLGILAAVMLTLSRRHRAWRIFPALLCGMGVLQLFGARRRFCVQYWGFGYLRSLEPWEKSEYNNLKTINSTPSTYASRRFSGYANQSSSSSIIVMKDTDDTSTLTSTTETGSILNSGGSLSIAGEGKGKSIASSLSSLFTLENGRTEEDEEEVNVRLFNERSYISRMFENGVPEIDADIRRIHFVIGSQLVAVGTAAMGVVCLVLLPIPIIGKI